MIPTYYPHELEGKFDVIFVATKSMGLRSMIEDIKSFVKEDTKIICILNGLGHVDTLKEYFDPENILIGVTVWTSGLGGAGILNATGVGKTDIRQVGENDITKSQELIKRMNKAGLNYKYSKDVYQAIWHKAGLNCVLNTYCTLIDCNINQYGSYPKNLELTRSVLNEIEKVAKAEGINIDTDIIEKNIEGVFSPETGGLHYPSLYQDLKNGRLTEIDYLNGAISSIGKKYGIETPVCDIITNMIHAKEYINGNK